MENNNLRMKCIMEYVEKRDLILKYIKLYKIDDDIKITEEML